MEYLFLVNIGPVQPFIASARRTHDLYVGSTLLSELSKTAAREIAQQEGPEGWKSLIFPAPQDEAFLQPNTPLNVANKIMAHIHQEPAILAPLVKKAITKRLNEIKERAYKKVGEIKGEKAQKQIDDLVDFSWVAVPFPTGSEYYLKREEIEERLAARKNTSYFQEVTWGDHEVKSSIDGQLECVIAEGLFPRRRDPQERLLRMSRYLYINYKAGPDERLSGVDLLKRHAEFSDESSNTVGKSTILSTSHLAALPFLQRLDTITDVQAQQKARDAWNAYLASIEKLLRQTNSPVIDAQKEKPVADVLERVPKSYRHSILDLSDGGMLFEERLLEHVPDSPSLQPILDAKKNFLKRIDEALGEEVRPTPYYAILLADGDSMGKVIEHEAEAGIERHQQLSRQLDGFAGQVASIVEKHQGIKVYAGGDDVLAFLPLHTVLNCARELATTFEKQLGDFKAEDKETHATLSVGIAIVHHLSLLQDALQIVRESEKKAKKLSGKNALAITVHKRSGEEYTAVGKWEKIYPWLQQLTRYYYDDDLAAGTPYELREVEQRLRPAQRETQSTKRQDAEQQRREKEVEEQRKKLQDVMQIEALRILRRKVGVPRGKMAKEKESRIMASFLQRLSLQQDSTGTITITNTVKLSDLIHELLVAQLLAAALKEAGIAFDAREEEGIKV